MKTQFYEIGPEQPVYLIAEIGLNHNGDVDLALKMIEAAARSGAHCAKFQLFDSTHFINSGARLGDGEPGSLQSFFQSFELSADEWQRVTHACKENRIDFLCSVFDEPSLDLYEKLGGTSVKIASTDLTCRPLLESVRKRKLGIYLSTGASNADEIERTVSWIGNPELLFQCVSSYPANPEDYNLRTLTFWQQKYGCLTGISDHCMELTLSLQMPALGGVAIERYFTLDRNMEGPDHSISSTPEDFGSLRRQLALLQKAMGNGVKRSMPSEEGVRAGGRRSLYFRADLKTGHVLQEEDILPQRPGGGMASEIQAELIGKSLVVAVEAGSPVESAHFKG